MSPLQAARCAKRYNYYTNPLSVIAQVTFMNIIEELVKKHHGKYSQDPKKASNLTSGRFTFQPQQGILTIDGTKVSININAVGGAAETAEPYRIVLHLEKNYESSLEIFPKTSLRRILDFFISKSKPTNSEIANKQFSFNGNNQLIRKLGTDNAFCTKLQHEKVFILISRKQPKHIVLTPAHGIDDIEHLEKLLSILKMIEGKIKSKNT
ncbi:hypothetical protein, partial [Ulvibacter litoralis]|uniref:hypothetical protein n=1 Tax=Ulvibacter litoralis TaxID=227084 RepID=UPI00167AAEA9